MSGWLVEALGASAILMAVVLLLRRPVARHFGPRVAYALWALPALRMALPPLPAAWRPAVAVPVLAYEHAAMPADGWTVGLVPLRNSGADLAALHRMAAPAMLSPRIEPVAAIRVDWTPLMLGIWIGGAALLLLWQIARYRRFLGRALDGATPIGAAAGTAILLSDRVAGPVATGIVRRRILLPRDFTRRYDHAAQRLVLDHEAAHHDRGDIIANAVALAMLALHWWNPLAWIAHRAFRADQELACDASVVARLDAAGRYAYASAVAHSAGFRTPAAISALGPASDLKRRLRTMAEDRMGRTRLMTGAAFAAVVIAGGLAASASVVSAENDARAQGRMPSPHARTAYAQAAPAAPATPIATRTAAIPAAPATPVAVDTPDVPDAPEAVEAPEAPEAPEVPEAPEPPEAPAPHDAAMARADAARAAMWGARAQAAGLRAEADAQRAIARMDIPRLVRTSLEAARAGLAAQCGANGHPVPASEQDFGKLATCGNPGMNQARIDRATLAGLEQARAQLAQMQNDPAIRNAMAQALATVDGEIARVRAQGPDR